MKLSHEKMNEYKQESSIQVLKNFSPNDPDYTVSYGSGGIAPKKECINGYASKLIFARECLTLNLSGKYLGEYHFIQLSRILDYNKIELHMI